MNTYTILSVYFVSILLTTQDMWCIILHKHEMMFYLTLYKGCPIKTRREMSKITPFPVGSYALYQ